MATVGYFGDVKFYVKRDKKKIEMLSFENAQWESSINIEEHHIQNKKPVLECIDRNADTFSMDIYISAVNHVHPMNVFSKLRGYCLNGRVYPLVIGGKRIGSFQFVIEKISGSLDKFYKNGKLISVTASVTFREYTYKKKKSKKTKVSKNNSKSKNGSSGKSKKTSGYTKYTVKKGDTLWKIAKKYYGKGTLYKKIYNANKTASKGFNKIKNPNKIYPGWVIKIPKK